LSWSSTTPNLTFHSISLRPCVTTVGTFVSDPKPVNAKAPAAHGGTISTDIMTDRASGIVVYTFPYDPTTILVLGTSIDPQSTTSDSRVAFLPSNTEINKHSAANFMNDPRFYDSAKKQFKPHANPDGTGPFNLIVSFLLVNFSVY
jgi:hypothetical protein